MNKTGRRGLSISALALCLYTPSFGETRRALLVGIDQYNRAPAGSSAALSDRSRARLAKVHGNPSRTSIAPLEGAVQDARDLAELLIRKFAFRPENVRVLVNSEATGDAILSGLEKFLVEPAAAGDVSLFFFAGHGSRIRNTATKNVSGLDSTILPADSLLGVPDLRSKELARIYLRAAARGIHMTVIQDSCFSGGGARGVVPGRKTRAQESDSNVSVTETLDRNPEEDGVLVLSASQDYQPAQEVQTETGSHGAFTWALLTAMETSGPNERVSRIFQRTRALMQSRVNDQEPAISLSSARVNRGLFAQPADSSPRGGTAAVGFVDHKTNLFELNSGITLGLHAGCELKRVVPSSPPVRIQIRQVNGPSSSNAALLSGDRDSVHVGDLFQLDKWVAPPQPVLRVFVGPGVAAEDLEQLHQLTGELGHTPGIGIVGDPSAVTADFVLLHDGEWKLASTGTEEVIIRSRSVPAFQDVIEAVKGSAASPRRIAVLVPPPAALAGNLRSQFAGAASPVSEAESPQTADYVLVGSTHSGALEYAWLRPGETQSDMGERQINRTRYACAGVAASQRLGKCERKTAVLSVG